MVQGRRGCGNRNRSDGPRRAAAFRLFGVQSTRTMVTEFMVYMSHPGGADVRRQFAGTRYSLLPVGPPRCRWHRTSASLLGVPEIEGPPPCESAEGWPCLNIRERALEGLPRYQLPDIRSVVFVPQVGQFGTVLADEWSVIKAGARSSGAIVVAHGYDVSLEILGYWNKHRARILATDPIRLRDVERWIADWIAVHSTTDEQWVKRRTGKFVPHIEAYAVMSAATGSSAKAIKKVVERARGSVVARK